MAWVYVLISQRDKNRYIGSTINLSKRLTEHNNGLVYSTRNRRPLVLYAYQDFNNITEARLTEKKYKKSRGAYENAIRKGLLHVVGE